LTSEPAATVFAGLTLKPVAMVSSNLASKPAVTVFAGLASKPVATVFSSLALKLLVTVFSWFNLKTSGRFFVGPQNQGGGWFSGLGLKIGSSDLIIWASKSLRWFLDLGLKTK
jgi:hypothetical protein